MVEKNVPVLVPKKVMSYYGGFTYEWQKGEYTGYSLRTGLHYFSLYNGDVVRMTQKELNQVHLSKDVPTDFYEKYESEG